MEGQRWSRRVACGCGAGPACGGREARAGSRRRRGRWRAPDRSRRGRRRRRSLAGCRQPPLRGGPPRERRSPRTPPGGASCSGGAGTTRSAAGLRAGRPRTGSRGDTAVRGVADATFRPRQYTRIPRCARVRSRRSRCSPFTEGQYAEGQRAWRAGLPIVERAELAHSNAAPRQSGSFRMDCCPDALRRRAARLASRDGPSSDARADGLPSPLSGCCCRSRRRRSPAGSQPPWRFRGTTS